MTAKGLRMEQSLSLLAPADVNTLIQTVDNRLSYGPEVCQGLTPASVLPGDAACQDEQREDAPQG